MLGYVLTQDKHTDMQHCIRQDGEHITHLLREQHSLVGKTLIVWDPPVGTVKVLRAQLTPNYGQGTQEFKEGLGNFMPEAHACSHACSLYVALSTVH